MLYCVVMTTKPQFRRIYGLTDVFFWTKNKYVAIKFYQCQLGKHTDSHKNAFAYSSTYYGVDFRVISDEKTAEDIMKNNPNNMIKIYQNHNKTVSVVVSAQMYFQIVSGRHLLGDPAAEFSDAIISSALRNLVYSRRFVKDDIFKNTMREVCMYDFKNCKIDPISRALLDAPSWLHYYVI